MASDPESAQEAVPAFNFSILRDIRKRADLTLSALSERSGVSVAVISKLERNQTQAEVGTLHKIGKVFGMRATDLLSLAEAPISNKKSSVSYKSGAFDFEAIRYGNADCIYGTAKAGARVSKPEIHHDDHEICWVLKGLVRLDLPKESHELEAGQSIQFDAIQEHSYEALEDCQVVIVHIRKDKRY
ncbi:helix-turn-helix domain-containing protein [Pelagicoccus sp. NFK12]|uniref:Helix-turn-helix domain-containing protein n=1 Tax=Pelagicoccus enzymogenes TaxID=2773457 RepID=A0A927F9P0_9BACT|nr:helix-turn-helix domain-containing protein [Pelagicoccus enzymogenes]MBD5779735.1 helix-turn-helix domain-containing protein [Pelagicoccus enzymogenes]MDQ8200233.1 helix-turn-helix domain-containing protein [Pelagicoccus enzymogenes]